MFFVNTFSFSRLCCLTLVNNLVNEGIDASYHNLINSSQTHKQSPNIHSTNAETTQTIAINSNNDSRSDQIKTDHHGACHERRVVVVVDWMVLLLLF